MRIALYARVSTDEQAKHGLSIEAQLFNLREWAKRNKHTIVGEYVDAGISGKKAPTKRPALSRFFAEVDNGLQVDLLVFTKLDRFFRSVKLYYQAVDVLDRHHIAWQAIQEDYETLTAGGRMKVNIMLSVAENEADRTSERIKVVFDRKIANGECVNPGGLPLGLTVKDKHVVPDENADAVRAAFEHYNSHGSVHETMDYLREEWGLTVLYKSLNQLLHNRLYIGEYRDNLAYCEPLIDRELFDSVQRGLQTRSIRSNPSKRTYIFSGLIVCAACGHKMIGVTNKYSYYSYRCQIATLNHKCDNHYHVGEHKLETYLLENLGSELDLLEASQTVAVKPKRVKYNAAKIQAKLDRLKDLYIDGLIDKDQYLADRERITEPMRRGEPEPPRVDFGRLRKIIGPDFEARYGALSSSDKQALWRSLLDRIEVSPDRSIRFFFKM